MKKKFLGVRNILVDILLIVAPFVIKAIFKGRVPDLPIEIPSEPIEARLITRGTPIWSTRNPRRVRFHAVHHSGLSSQGFP